MTILGMIPPIDPTIIQKISSDVREVVQDFIKNLCLPKDQGVVIEINYPLVI